MLSWKSSFAMANDRFLFNKQTLERDDQFVNHFKNLAKYRSLSSKHR